MFTRFEIKIFLKLIKIGNFTQILSVIINKLIENPSFMIILNNRSKFTS